MSAFVYINGQYTPGPDAKVSVFDRSVLFGDSVYEVIPVYQGRPYFLNRHLARLEYSLTQAQIPLPDEDWQTLFTKLIELNGGENLQIYLQISRGSNGIRQHNISSDLVPTVIAFTLHTPYPSYQDKLKGLTARLVEDNRWSRCDIKTTSLIANILLNHEAISQGSDTAFLIREGILTEGSSSNVFLVDTSGALLTPPQNNFCLPGITRQLTCELANHLGWSVREEHITKEALFKANEVWVTSTSKEIYPVLSIDDLPIGQGIPGHYWKKIDRAYQDMLKDYHDGE